MLRRVLSNSVRVASALKAPSCKFHTVTSTSFRGVVASKFTGARFHSTEVGPLDHEPEEPLHTQLTRLYLDEVYVRKNIDSADLDGLKEEVSQVFTIHDEEGFSTVRLTAELEDCSVEVDYSIHCTETAYNSDEEDEEEKEEGDENEEDDYKDQEYGIQCDVYIRKKDGSAMVFDCIASVDFDITNVRHVPPKNASDPFDESMYFGPVFDTLDETMQQSFREYLRARHVDENLALFVLAYANDKEQRERMNFLRGMTSLVTPDGGGEDDD
jgi:complement component 1 Q subcomponent-binding protein, mitochondrial